MKQNNEIKGNNQKSKWRDIENDDLKEQNLTDFLTNSIVYSKKYWRPNAVAYISFAMRNIHHLLKTLDEADIHYPIPIIWNKDAFNISWNRYHPDYEVIVYCGPGSIPTGKNSRWYGPNNERCVWNIKREASSTYVHPTQKPIEVCARAIRNSSIESEVVLDLFGGSGSTLIAAEQLNRKCIMMEMSEKYCEVIALR
jgi:hypothetical protein